MEDEQQILIDIEQNIANLEKSLEQANTAAEAGKRKGSWHSPQKASKRGLLQRGSSLLTDEKSPDRKRWEIPGGPMYAGWCRFHSLSILFTLRLIERDDQNDRVKNEKIERCCFVCSFLIWHFSNRSAISLIADNYMEDSENNGINHIFYG